jgi:ABC-type dipeptide/oligopeptide/nickel transport system permease subunit
MAREVRETTLDSIIYPLQIGLRRVSRASVDFLRELASHPTAVLGAVLTLAYFLAAIFAPQLSPHDPIKGNLRLRLLPPAWQEGGDLAYPLGTDVQGRDLLSRIIYGSRVSLRVGFWVVGTSVVVGTTLGTIAGYHRGRLDDIICRLVDLLLAFPYLIFAVAVMAFLGPGFTNMLIALSFKSWVPFFRLVRAETLSQKTKEYVDAAKVTGRSTPAIIFSEILPNIFHSILVLVTLRMGTLILSEAALSYLGLGIQPPTPAWGSMVSDGRDHLMTSWWVSTLPGVAILVLVMSINLFGEGLRDVLDPRLKVE